MFQRNFFSAKKIKPLAIILMSVLVAVTAHTPKVFAFDPLIVGAAAGAVANGASSAVDGLVAGFGTLFMQGISYALYFFLWVESFFVGLVGIIFNVVFDYTVVHISDFVKNAQIIDTGWGIVRDLSNILFIFALLYLAIATILQLDEHGVKHALSRLIIAAVLINFSLLFTKVIIDVPNLLAIKIYDAIKVEEGGGLGDAFMSVFNPAGAVAEGDISQAGVTGGLKKFTEGAAAFSNLKNPITTFAMGMVLDMAIIFVFLAVIIIFLKRFVILIFLMIFSPLAFAGMAVHALEHDVKEKFWNTLIRESFYAPAFMLCVYITLKMGQAIVKGNIAVNGNFTAWSEYINIPYIFGFSVVIMMSVASLIVAEEMGVSGAGQAMGAFNGMKDGFSGWVGTNTIGRAAHTFANKGASATWIADASAGKKGLIMTYVGRGIGGTLSKAGKGFGEKVHTEEEYKKAADEEHHKSTEERVQGLIRAVNSPAGLFSADRQSSDLQQHHWSPSEKAKSEVLMEQKLAQAITDGNTAQIEAVTAALTHYAHRASPEEREKIDQLKRAGLAEHKNTVIEDDGHGKLKVNYTKDAWENKLTDGQRKYILENLSAKEASTLHGLGHLKEMVDITQSKDTNAIEGLVKSGKADKLVKETATLRSVASAVKVNMFDAYKATADAAAKAALEGEFQAQYGENIANYDKTLDEPMAELYNKNLNRYTTPDNTQKRLLADAKKIKDAATEAKEAAKTAAAVTKMATDVINTVRSINP